MYLYRCLCGMFSFLIWMEISNLLSLRQHSMYHMIYNQMILSRHTCVTCLQVCHWCDLGNHARDRKNSDFWFQSFSIYTKYLKRGIYMLFFLPFHWFKVYLIDRFSVLFPFSNGINTFGFLGPMDPLHFCIFPLGSIAPFPFYSIFDVATTIVELQQLYRNSSIIKGIISCNLFLLKFLMSFKEWWKQWV